MVCKCVPKKCWRGIVVFVLFFSHASVAQEIPVFSQFFLNPYILNPAYAGAENQAVLYFSHRQQWAGIEGAPATSLLSFNTPLKRKLSFGANIMNDARGLISTSSAELTLAYILPTFKRQFIRFGLSGGFGMNRLALHEADNPNDPALLGIADNNFYTTAKFGVSYAISGFHIGAAFPALLNNNIFNQYDFSPPEIKPLEKYILMANYTFQLSDNGLTLAPHIVYRQYGNSFDQVELLGVFHIQDKVWVGGSYKTDYGFSAFAGLKFMERFSVGYAYEMASSMVNSFSDGTHEFVFGIKIGKKREPVYAKVMEHPTVVTEKSEPKANGDVAEELPKEETEEIPIKEEEDIEQENSPSDKLESGHKSITEEEEERHETITSGDSPYELQQGHYVIVGAYRSQDNARKHIQQLIYKGFHSRYGYGSAKGLFYVYITKTFDLEEARRERNKISKINIYQFEDAWILTVE